jgi:hypothetical protein
MDIITIGLVLITVALMFFRKPGVKFPFCETIWRASDYLWQPGVAIYWLGQAMFVVGFVIKFFEILNGI